MVINSLGKFTNFWIGDMNIYTMFTDKELDRSTELEALVRNVKAASDHDGFGYYYKIFPSSVGQSIYFVCEELHMEVDITDHAVW